MNLIQIQSLGLSEYLLIDYQNWKDFRLFILQNTKNRLLKIFVLLSFFSLVRNRTNRKNLDRNFEILIECRKTITSQTKKISFIPLWCQLYKLVMLENFIKTDWLGSSINIIGFWSTNLFEICEYSILTAYYHKYHMWRNARYLQLISNLLKKSMRSGP